MGKPLDLLNESVSPSKIIWMLAWPTLLEQIMITMVQYINTAMVGGLGEQATAAIAVSASTTWLINGIFAAFGVGFSVLVGHSMGAGNFEQAKRIIRQSFIAIVTVGISFTAITQVISRFLPMWMGADSAIWGDSTAYLSIVGCAYLFSVAIVICAAILRCSGDTRTPLIFTSATNVLTVILNIFLIYPARAVDVFGINITLPGASLGVRGAAISTAISMAVTGTALAATLFLRKRPIQIALKDGFKFEKDIWKSMFRLATPVALERITIAFGHIVMTAMVTGLGTTALTAHHLAITAEGLTYMPAFGFAAAATTLVAQSLGAKKAELGYKYGHMSIWGGIIFMSIMGVVLFVFAESLISIFTPSAEAIKLGGQVLKLEAFAQPFYAAAIIAAGALRGGGDTRWPFYLSVIGMWGVRLGIAYVCAYTFNLGLFGAWIGMFGDIFVCGVLTYRRYISKKWLIKPSVVIKDGVAV